jgi:hypothetical protein
MLTMVAIKKRALATGLFWLITRMEQATTITASMEKINISISPSV